MSNDSENVVDGGQIPGPLPNVEVYNNYLQRAKNYCTEVLVRGGMAASKGITVTAKFKQFFLATTGAKDLKEITVPQWETIWAQLAALAVEGNVKAVEAVQNFSCSINKQTSIDVAGTVSAAIVATISPSIPAPDYEAWLQQGAPLVQNHKQAKWALGDWLLQADQAGAGLWPWQIQGMHPSWWLKAAAEHYGYAHGTFLEFERVARVFPPPTRVGGLSWHHHQSVAAIESAAVRAEWLSLAKFAGWSSKDLQQKVAIAKAGLTMSEAVELSQIAAVLGMAPSEVQVLIVRAFLAKNDETRSEFVFKHRASFE